MKKFLALAALAALFLLLGCQDSPTSFLQESQTANQSLERIATNEDESTAAGGTLANGLVAFYPFSGNAKDKSGKGHHGTVHGAHLTVDRSGNANRAYRFDGIDDYIAVSSFPFLDSTFTYVAWLQVTGETDQHQSFGAHGERFPDETWNFGYNTLQKQWDMFDNTNGPWQVNMEICSIWTHVAIVYDRFERRIYVNGRLIGAQPIATPIAHGASDTLRIGTLAPGVQQFEGAIDDVRIYNRALAVSEIRQIYYK